MIIIIIMSIYDHYYYYLIIIAVILIFINMLMFPISVRANNNNGRIIINKITKSNARRGEMRVIRYFLLRIGFFIDIQHALLVGL
jgi:hypothetical protein